MRILLTSGVRCFIAAGNRLVHEGFIDEGSLFTIGTPVVMECEHCDQPVTPFQKDGVTLYLLVRELSREQQTQLGSLASV